jgi:hypothetical protein
MLQREPKPRDDDGEDYHAAFQLGPDQTLAGVLDEYEQVGRQTAH